MPEGLAKDGFDENLVYKSFPLLAPLRHARVSRKCPFTGADRKSPWFGQTDANDPKRSLEIVNFD
jgi:hypothetical protein